MSEVNDCIQRAGAPLSVYTRGTFDLFHYGHVKFLRNIKRYFRKKNRAYVLGQSCKLIVAVEGDHFSEGYTPVIHGNERLEVVRSCQYVDDAFIVPSRHNHRYLIEQVYKPSYIVLGSNWKTKNYFNYLNITEELLDSMQCKILFIPYTKAISTTIITQRIKNDKLNSAN